MASADTVRKIKLAVRMSHDKLNDDISDTIDLCLADLQSVGITADENKKMIYAAIRLYCHAEYEKDPVLSERWLQRYKELKGHLSTNGDYMEAEKEDE